MGERRNIIEGGIEEAQRSSVISEAKTWLKTPFEDNQRCKGAGVDCLGLIVACYEAAGVVGKVDVPPYSAQWLLHQKEEKYLKNLFKYCTEVYDPESGNIALFHFGKTWSHSAIIVDWPTEIIHSFVGRGVELCNPSIDGAFRHRWEHARFFDPWRMKK